MDLQQVASVLPVVGDITLTEQMDFVLVNTATTSITVTLPEAKGGKEFEVVKYATANRVVIVPAAGETILGADEVYITTIYDALRLKAIEGTGWVAI